MTRAAELETEDLGLTECAELFTERCSSFWSWAFGPRGDGVVAQACRDDEGRVLAAIAALRVPALSEGQEAHLLQVVAAYSSAAGLQRDGRFVRVAEQFARSQGGPVPDGAPLIYGIATRPMWRIAKERLSAKVMRTQDVLRVELNKLALPASADCTIEGVAEFPSDVDALKLRQSEQSGLVCRPTAGTLNHRFATAPHSGYRIALAKRAGVLVGYAVFKVGETEFGDRSGVIWDWCVPGSDAQAGVALLGWLAETAESEQVTKLAIVLPDTHPDWVSLQRVGFRVYGSKLVVAVRHFPRQMTMRWLYHNWNYSLSDLVIQGPDELYK